jgi:hypothetical protein
MRKVASILIFLLMISQISASVVVYGTIKINVMNRPPRIVSLKIIPETAYYDSTISCIPSIDDETPETVSMDYTWKINSVKQENRKNSLSEFDENDTVECTALATDETGLISEPVTSKIIIYPAPANIVFVKSLVSLAGFKSETSEIVAGANLITGMVAGNKSGGLDLLPLIVLTAVMLLMNIFLLSKIRKVKFPKQDF